MWPFQQKQLRAESNILMGQLRPAGSTSGCSALKLECDCHQNSNSPIDPIESVLLIQVNTQDFILIYLTKETNSSNWLMCKIQYSLWPVDTWYFLNYSIQVYWAKYLKYH